MDTATILGYTISPTPSSKAPSSTHQPVSRTATTNCLSTNSDGSSPIYQQPYIQQGFKSWKEISSTSPSNRHIGHYCHSYDPTAEQPTKKSTKHLAIMIMETHHEMTSICPKLGVSLTRWQEIVTAMLEKEPGRTKLHWLRVIHLIEAD